MELAKITADGIAAIIEWSDGTDADFLRQWSGRNYTYPITAEQINARLNGGARIFEARRDDEIVGVIDIIDVLDDGKTAYIGCFLINPSLRGKGCGGEIPEHIKIYCKKLGCSSLTLCVFDYNAGARRCYEKAGFTEYDRQDRGGCSAIYMRAEI